MPGMVRALVARGVRPVVVVDDGSGGASRALFDEVAATDGCTVLRHDVNRGKGAALQTAFGHLAGILPPEAVVVTADADGQHDVGDCVAVAHLLDEPGDAIALGVREFRLGRVPFRSWWGNVWTALLFWLLYGRRLGDTQTGLRAFRAADIPFLLSVAGDGYEYEMGVLCAAARSHREFRKSVVSTIYSDGNATSHFSPLRDTVRIYRVLFARRFGSCSGGGR